MNSFLVKSKSKKDVIDVLKSKDPSAVVKVELEDQIWIDTILFWQDVRALHFSIDYVFEATSGIEFDSSMYTTIADNVYAVTDIPAKLAQNAMDVQSACNISGVILSMARDLEVINKHPGTRGTAWRNNHPVLLMYIMQLCHLGYGCTPMSDDNRYSKAYDICCRTLEWTRAYPEKLVKKVSLEDAFKKFEPGCRIRYRGTNGYKYILYFIDLNFPTFKARMLDGTESEFFMHNIEAIETTKEILEII